MTLTAMACQQLAALSARGTKPAFAAGPTSRQRRPCQLRKLHALLGGMTLTRWQRIPMDFQIHGCWTEFVWFDVSVKV